MHARTRLFALAAVTVLALASAATPVWAARSAHAARAAGRSVAATATVAVPATLTITAVGDVCFASAPGRLIASQGPKAPFAAVASTLNSADITLGNLECALSKRGTPVPGKAFTFRGDPKATIGLNYAGFDVVGLGNNHARDFGATALLDTEHYLDNAGIRHAGAGKNSAEAFAPVYLRSHDTTVAFLSFSQIGPANFAAGKKRAGTAYTKSLKTVKAAVKAAKKKAAYVIVSFHWGIEGQYTPTSTQVQFGRGAIDAGADLVLSEHPHVIQGVEFYHKKLIAYSLGNFVFSPGSAAGHDSMILHLTIGPHGIQGVSATPAFIGSTGAPAIAKGANATRILGTIAKTSKGRGTKVRVAKSIANLKP